MALDKEKIKDYLADNWDVTLENIIEDFNISEEDVPALEKFLEELEKEEWIMKSFCNEHKKYEYDPGIMHWGEDKPKPKSVSK